MTSSPTPPVSNASQRTRGLGWIGPAALVATAALIAFVMLGNDDPPPVPIHVAADGARFEELVGLFDAADIVVEGTIVARDTGRTITDPANPDAGLITALFELDVATVFKGAEVGPLTIEQEATLLDETPIIVNDLVANQVGDTGFWFLVEGSSDEFPYVALVNEQARLLVDDLGNTVRPSFFEPTNPGRLRAELAKLTTEHASSIP